MEQSALLKAVRDETLSNDEAILELYERRDHYAACDLSQEHHVEIARLFEAAVLDMRKAVAAHEPVVKVLKKVLLDLGSLLKAEKEASHTKDKFQASPQVGVAAGESKQEVQHGSSARPPAIVSQSHKGEMATRPRDPAVPSAENKKTESVSGLSRSLTTSKTVGTAALTTAKNTVGKRDEPEQTRLPSLQKIQANLKAENPGWSQEKIQKMASDHLVLILSQQRENAEKAKVRLSRKHNVSHVSDAGSLTGMQQSQVDGQGSDDARRLPPSRSVSPSDPFSAMGTSTSTAIAASPTAALASGFPPARRNAKRLPRSSPKAPALALKRRKTPLKEKKTVGKEGGNKYKSDEIVVDSDESDTEMKGSDTSAPFEVDVVDPSEGLAGFENLDEDGNYVKKPHSRFVLVNGKPRAALVVKLKVSPEKLLGTLYGEEVKVQRKKLELSMSANGPRNRQSRVENLSSTSDKPNTVGGLNASAFAPQTAPKMVSDNEDAGWESDPETTTATMMTTTAPLPSVELPNFPILTAAHLPPFMKGLIIAIENITEDHAKKPDDTLLELVEELDGNKPTLPVGNVAGDDRHVVLSGGEYVYAAVCQIYADATPVKDSPMDSGINAEGNTAMTSAFSEDVNADQLDDVKLTDHHNGITALPEKAQYKGKGRVWKKTPGDADPAFRAASKVSVSNLPKRKLSRRKATRGNQPNAWKEQGIEELFGAFRAHVKREYWFQAGHVGIKPDKEVLPDWLWER
ncbi:hypothetical protein PMIN04_000724 [Paraphaeosphaeria minitans]